MTIKAMAMGGTTWAIYSDSDSMGIIDAGTLDSEGQLVEDEDEIASIIIDAYNLPSTTTVNIGF